LQNTAGQDTSIAPAHRIAASETDFTIECPWRDGGEAKEAEQQAGGCPEPHKGTDLVST